MRGERFRPDWHGWASGRLATPPRSATLSDLPGLSRVAWRCASEVPDTSGHSTITAAASVTALPLIDAPTVRVGGSADVAADVHASDGARHARP